jgi:4,5-DOPA dioxygenase extradiol
MSAHDSNPKGKMPVLFVGHGSPMNAIEDTPWSRGWAALGAGLPTPTAILSVSAHWLTPGTLVTAQASPKTIHDFGGFPRALFEVQYPARGDQGLAARVRGLLSAPPSPSSVSPQLDEGWGFDHGTWSVLVHLRPKADVPVIQLSMDARASPAAHYAMGQALRPLRDEGVLIMASGNVTHNLRHAFGVMRAGEPATTPPWASRFDTNLEHALLHRDHARVMGLVDDDDGRMSHPTEEHWLPMLYAAGAGGDDDVSFPVTGFDAGSLSMRSVRFG